MPATRTQRPTITDVARAAGVSTAVVSYALNDRPGVSAATRERVLRVAEEFGWRPNAAARSVRAGPQSVGLVVTDRPGTVARDPAFLDLVAAIRDVLTERGLALGVHVVDQADDDVADLCRTWWAERRFDAVIIPDLLTDDPRVSAMGRARAPAVAIGPAPSAAQVTHVGFDEGMIGTAVMATLAALGHRRVASLTGPVALQRTRTRLDAMSTIGAGLGAAVLHRETDASPEAAAAATHALLAGADRPSAVVYDSPEAAVAGLEVARRTRLRVPWDVSIVSLGDSALCRLTSPPITVVPLPIATLGRAVGKAVLAALDGRPGTDELIEVGGVVLRGSTGPHTATST